MAPECCTPCRDSPSDRCGTKRPSTPPPDNMCDPCNGSLPPGCTCTPTTKCFVPPREETCADPCMGPRNIAKCKADEAKAAHCGLFGSGKSWEECSPQKKGPEPAKKLPYCDLRKPRDCSELNGNACNTNSKGGEGSDSDQDELCPKLPPRTNCICEMPPSQYPKFCAPKYLCNVKGHTGKWYAEPSDDVIVPLNTGPKLSQAAKCIACKKADGEGILSDCPIKKRKNDICSWGSSAGADKDSKGGNMDSCGTGMKGGMFQKVKSWFSFSKGGKDGGKEGGE